ncbi:MULTISPECIES: hypothetical protein [Agrobacterium]|uniref:Uncharacterized protein n=1 Tax=Agrobacterium tumefaciens TaxID=358 RepID=A0AAF0H482_AGRTU|nr:MULTISPECIES: hypothetical protein [Agrobacterium]WGM61743.1 hypothetical protein CFBP5506_19180 [Agrobacterium tumefaciens]CVI64221.1 hypothetical protein AGR9A_Lc50092 [Agrobacterium salinitolerans str. Hayward 0363]
MMLEELGKKICNIAPRAFAPCAPDPWPFGWSLSDGEQLFISTLLGAVVGAVVAGTIQYLISKEEFKRNIRQSATEHRRVRRVERAEQLRRNETIALHIGVKAITITNQMYSTIGLILNSVEDANAAGLASGGIAEKMVPMSGINHDPVQFSSEELAFLFWSGEAELANKLMLINEKYSSLTDTIHTYNESRLAFPEINTGNVPLIKIRQRELHDLAVGICLAFKEDFQEMLGVMEEIPAAFDRTFKKTGFFTAKIPGGGQERLNKLVEVLKAHGI